MRPVLRSAVAALVGATVALATLILVTPAQAQTGTQPAAPDAGQPSAPQAAPQTAPQTSPQPNMAQSKVKGTHGAWNYVCDTPPGASSEQCALIQNVVSAERAEVGLSVVVLRTADGKSQILRVLAPLGVLLPNGLGLNVDGQDIGRAYFVRCFQDGCYAEVILEEKLIGVMKAGKQAIFTVFQTPEEGIGIPVDLAGFSEGFGALQ